MSFNRFIDSGFSEIPTIKSSLMDIYQYQPLLSLEEAIQELTSIVPGIEKYTATALKKFNRHSDLLTRDESAAIYIYTIPMSGVRSNGILNVDLQNEKRDALKPWFSYLKLFTTALNKLPPERATIWRGVNSDVTETCMTNKSVHNWWSFTSCSKDRNVIRQVLGEHGTIFAIHAINAKDITQFSANPDEQEVLLMPGTCLRVKTDIVNLNNGLPTVHLEEIDSSGASNYLFDRIKQEYLHNNRLYRFVNPSQSFPIEQNYINLVIVHAKDQLEKEKQMNNIQHGDVIMGTYEDIYGVKTTIDVEDILKSCQNEKKQVLVFGRAGIGKSTFCRYIAYQWAKGSYWSKYELVALIPLRNLTTDRYPPNKVYSVIDLVEKEVFSFGLNEMESDTFKKLFDAKKTLWILDGYDEIVQNIPLHLKYLFEQLLNTPNHILTSRPYLNTLSYDVQMEIVGFTDKNIEQYVHQFFRGFMHDLDARATNAKSLLQFLKLNPNIFGIAHIPVNLELICSIWSNTDPLSTENLTITALYTEIVGWLCRRYLLSRNMDIKILCQEDVYAQCDKELTFLQCLAFKAMENNRIIIQPELLQSTLHETNILSTEYPCILNMGVLKSFSERGIGTQIESEKDHYFVHLSFQEYFAARYVANLLRGSSSNKMIELIKNQKYNQRYTLMFTFVADLLSKSHADISNNTFWNIILEKPIDVVGIRHIQLIIRFLEATSRETCSIRRTELLAWIAHIIQHNLHQQNDIILMHIASSLKTAPSVASDERISNVLLHALEYKQEEITKQVLSFISSLNLLILPNTFYDTIVTLIDNENDQIRRCAQDLIKSSENATIIPMINKLNSDLNNTNNGIKVISCRTIEKIGEKAATDEVIHKLVSALGDQDRDVRNSACAALENIGEKAATDEILNTLISTLSDQSSEVRKAARQTITIISRDIMSSKSTITNKLMSALESDNKNMRLNVCKTLGMIGKKIATEEITHSLLNVVENDNRSVSNSACEALCKITENVAPKNVIDKLITLIRHDKNYVSENAMKILSNVIGSPGALSLIDPSIILDLMSKYSLNVQKNISIEEVIHLFIETKHTNWLTVIIRLLCLKPIAVVFDANELLLYDCKEPIKFTISERQVAKQLYNAIVNEAKKFQLYSEKTLGFEPISNGSSFTNGKNGKNNIFTFEPNNVNEANFNSQFSEDSKLMLAVKNRNMYQNFVLLSYGVEFPMKYSMYGRFEMKKYDDQEKFITGVLKTTNKMIYLVVSMNNYHSIVPLVHKHYCVERIYLYGSNDITSISTSLYEYEKVNHFYSDMEKLFHQVEYDMKKVTEDSVHWKKHAHTSYYTMLHTQQLQYRESVISVTENKPTDECVIILSSQGSHKKFRLKDLQILIHKCKTVEKCLETISNEIQSKIFLIISGYSDLSNIQKIFYYSSIYAIYFLGEYDIKCLIDKNKVAGFFENSDQLSNQLKGDIQFYREHHIHTTEINIFSPMKPKQGTIPPLNDQNNHFLVYNFFADILSEMPLLDFNEQDLSNICKKLYPNNVAEIKRYINQLYEANGIANFTLDPRFSQIITNIHQSDELNALLVFQKTLVNIQKCSFELADLFKLESVYLVKIVSENTLEKLKAAKGCYISLGFFILATKSFLVARDIARVMANNNLITILFQIQIDVGTRIFELQPNHVMFPLSPLFSFESMNNIAADGVYYIRIKSMYSELKSMKEQFQCEMCESLSWQSYGNYLYTLKESEKAKNYYRFLIKKIPWCHKDELSINERLEYISNFQYNDSEYEQFDDLVEESTDYDPIIQSCMTLNTD